jgi:hypothetical protein
MDGAPRPPQNDSTAEEALTSQEKITSPSQKSNLRALELLLFSLMADWRLSHNAMATSPHTAATVCRNICVLCIPIKIEQNPQETIETISKAVTALAFSQYEYLLKTSHSLWGVVPPVTSTSTTGEWDRKDSYNKHMCECWLIQRRSG